MAVAVAIDELVEAALRSPRPEGELRGTVRALLASGYQREPLVRELNRVRIELEEGGREAEGDLLFDLLDALAGWCAPEVAL